MEIRQSTAGEVLVLEPEGSLDSTTIRVFDRTLTEAIDGGGRLILIDGAKLELMSSVGLRVLLQAAKRLKPRGGKLALCALNKHLQSVFALSGFDKVFPIYPARDEGLAALRAGRE